MRDIKIFRKTVTKKFITAYTTVNSCIPMRIATMKCFTLRTITSSLIYFIWFYLILLVSPNNANNSTLLCQGHAGNRYQ